MKRQLLKYCVALIATLTSVTAMWADGEESYLTYNEAGGYYEITSAADVVTLANEVNNTKTTSSDYRVGAGRVYKVTVSELDFSSIMDFPIIGKDDYHRFAGTFDGQGVVIKNLTIKGFNTYGLFGVVEDGIVKNITLDESCNVYGNNTGGAFVGRNRGGTISGCVSKATIEAGSFVGGIVGINHGTITDSKNYGAIDCRGESVAGIAGENASEDCLVSNCENHGGINQVYLDAPEFVNASRFAAGIVGHNTHGQVVNCQNTAPVSSNNQDVGGIAGGNGGLVKECTNSGTVYSPVFYVGGIVGSNSYGQVVDCTNSGNVSGREYTGGVVGWYYRSTVSGCSVSGVTVTGGDYGVGAVIGGKRNLESPISENYYYSDVIVVSQKGYYSGLTLRGIGSSSAEEEPTDINEITVQGTTYYNGAVLKLRDGETSVAARQYVHKQSDSSVYDIHGRKVSSNSTPLEGLTRGVYIVHGKKVVK